MPLDFHTDPHAKFEHQTQNAAEYIVPFVEETVPLSGAHVLEIGCGEGGVLHPFVRAGATCVGLDLSKPRIGHARRLAEEAGLGDRIRFVASDVHSPEVAREFGGSLDLVILKDAIEHIPDQEKLLVSIRGLLKPSGVVFIAFPPWLMPYGGHQQLADTKIGKLPFYHVLPRRAYHAVLRAFGESEVRQQVLLEIYDTRLSIRDFERMVFAAGMRIVRRQFYLINPIYRFKFGLRPIKQLPVVRSIPWLRDFTSTTAYYVIGRA